MRSLRLEPLDTLVGFLSLAMKASVSALLWDEEATTIRPESSSENTFYAIQSGWIDGWVSRMNFIFHFFFPHLFFSSDEINKTE